MISSFSILFLPNPLFSVQGGHSYSISLLFLSCVMLSLKMVVIIIHTELLDGTDVLSKAAVSSLLYSECKSNQSSEN